MAHIGEARIRFAVDRIHAVLRIPQDTIDAVPSILNRGAGEAQIQSIHRSPDGRGIVSILSAERLFREDTVARLVAETRERDTGMGGPTQEKSTEQALVFQLGEEEFGLPIGAVREVVRLPRENHAHPAGARLRQGRDQPPRAHAACDRSTPALWPAR